MTPDKMNVANWLRSLPVNGDLGSECRPPSRMEVSKASLVLSFPGGSNQNHLEPSPPAAPIMSQNPIIGTGTGSSIERAETTDEEPPSFRSSEEQAASGVQHHLQLPRTTASSHLRLSTGHLTNRVR